MTKREIIIDGAEGEGGGQVLRSSLSLSAITGKPVRIEDVRGRRKKPGLFRQHLTAFKAAAEICDAKVEGAELKSREIAFHPGEIKAGDYHFSIGSAGSAMLVAQTVLPILSHAKGESTVRITGGTHNLWAPTFEFFDQTFLPLFRKMGGRAQAELGAYGFNPAGGGEIILKIKPYGTPNRLDLLSRGERLSTQLDVVLSGIKRGIASREVKVIANGFNLSEDQSAINHVKSAGPGNVMTLALEFENLTQLFTEIGQKGISSEAVANQLCERAKGYLQAKDKDGSMSVATCDHLADQLLLLMALLGGGVFTTTDISQHTYANIDIIRAFVNVEISVNQIAKKCWLIEVN